MSLHPWIASNNSSENPGCLQSERRISAIHYKYIVPALGPIIYRYNYVDAARDGVLAQFSLINLEVDLLRDESIAYRDLSKRIAVAYARADEDVVENLLRRRASVSTTAAMRVPVAVRLIDKHRGERAVVFHERTEAADTICTNLRARGHRATIYHTGIGASLRRDNLRLFRKGIFDVLVCCKALDEGINVPETQVGVLASSTASDRQRIQRLGRLLRPRASFRSVLCPASDFSAWYACLLSMHTTRTPCSTSPW